MTEHDDRTAAFLEKLTNLDIEISVGTEGVYTACSSSEPRFCFDGYSQAEVAERVIEALHSYARLYFGLEDLDLRPNRQDIPEPAVRFEAPRPVSKLAVAFA